MAVPSWFSANAARAFPFLVYSVNRKVSGPLTPLNLPNPTIVDAGFVAGPLSRFVPGTHSVWLAVVRRQGSWLYFDFASDAPGLYGALLTFGRRVDAGKNLTTFADSADDGLSLSGSASASASAAGCVEPLWSGFLTTGDFAPLLALLPGDGEIAGTPPAAVLEPTLIQSLAGGAVARLALANDDRTRATAPPGCPDLVWPFVTGQTRASALCLAATVAFVPGYNCAVRQNVRDNSVTVSPAVGQGAGQPCGEQTAFPGEAPAAGETTLSGGPRCNEVFRMVNGLGGPQVDLLPGIGVTVTPSPEASSIQIDVDLHGMLACGDFSGVSGVSEISQSV